MKRKNKKDRSIFLRIFILIVCGYFTVTLANLWGELNDSKKELARLQKQLADEQVEAEELRAMLKEESNTPLIEKAARERLGYVYSNEQVFVDISGN